MRFAPSFALVFSLAIATSGLVAAAMPASALGVDAEDPAQADLSALPLEGTHWRLLEYVRRDEMRPSGPEVAAWISLTAGSLRGSGGCNKLVGTYATVGDHIAIEGRRKGERSCAEQSMVVEIGLQDGLRRAARYQIAPASDVLQTMLVLSDSEGLELLRFGLDDAASLGDHEWRLSAYTAEGAWIAADPLQPAVLNFDPQRQNTQQRSSEGDVVGSSGCNGLVGRFSRQASVLSFGALEVTDAPCGANVAAQQQAMLAVLDAEAIRVELPPDRLRLSASESGEQLEFEASSPLEGSTWLLAKLPGGADPESSVTLRLTDGRLEGEGPCGPYSGSYETESVVLTFKALAGSGADGCADARLERRLLEALRRTVLTDRTNANLRLLDAFGKTVARFELPGGP